MAKGIAIFASENCKGCELCLDACPLHLIEMDKEKINQKGYHPAFLAREEECIGCASCALMCPDSVITVERE